MGGNDQTPVVLLTLAGSSPGALMAPRVLLGVARWPTKWDSGACHLRLAFPMPPWEGRCAPTDGPAAHPGPPPPLLTSRSEDPAVPFNTENQSQLVIDLFHTVHVGQAIHHCGLCHTLVQLLPTVRS